MTQKWLGVNAFKGDRPCNLGSMGYLRDASCCKPIVLDVLETAYGTNYSRPKRMSDS